MAVPSRRVSSRTQQNKVTAIQKEKNRLTAKAAAKPVEAPVPLTSKRGLRKAIQPLKLGSTFTIGPVKPVHRRFINAMVYGPYGVGKTTFVGSADDVPAMRDVLFVNADSGTMSLTNRRTMDFVDISHYDQLARIFEFLTLHCYYRDQVPMNVEKLLELERELKGGRVEVEDQTGEPDPDRTWYEEQRLRSGKPMDEPYIYRTVVLDSISEFHKLLIYKFTGIDLNTQALDEEVEKMDSWQQAQELFRLMVRQFRNLPMNFLMVSAEEIATRNDSDKKKGRRPGTAYPKLAGAMAGDIAGFIDIVGYLVLERSEEEGEEAKRYLYLGAGYEGWISKHRFENLPDLEYLENPSLTSLIDLARKDAQQNGTSEAQRSPEGRTVSANSRSTVSAATKRSGRADAQEGSRRGSGRPVRRDR